MRQRKSCSEKNKQKKPQTTNYILPSENSLHFPDLLLLVSQQPDVTLGNNIANEHVSQKIQSSEWITPNIFAKCVTETSQEILFKNTFLVPTDMLVWIHL